MARELTAIAAQRGSRPLLCVGDNGTELASNAIQTWCQSSKQQGGLALHRARQTPAECVCRELHRALRDECLDETLFTSLRQARAMLAVWQRDYNEVRPHSAHCGRTPPSIRQPPCSPASSPLRAGFADGLQPGLTQAARGGADEEKNAARPNRKRRHDRRGGNQGLYF